MSYKMLDTDRWIRKEYVLPVVAGGVVLIVFCTVLLLTSGTSDDSTQCITSADCTPDRTCVDRKCEDACSKCGAHTFCHVTKHIPYCSCIHGFEGNPLTGCTPGPNTHAAIKECTTDDQCSQDLACKDRKCQDPCQGVCGVNAVCHVRNHLPACVCNPGYTGDPFKSCQPQKPQCVSSDQCSSDLACINHECKDPCVGVCGVNTHCAVKNHHSFCSCIEGHTGNPLHGCRPQGVEQRSRRAVEQLSNTLTDTTKKYYHVYTDMQVDWLRALYQCWSNGMVLATIYNEAQYQEIVTQIKNKKPAENINNFWISAVKDFRVGYRRFVWFPSKDPVVYAKWGPEEPSEQDNKNCVELRGEQGYKMYNQKCTDKIFYVCESGNFFNGGIFHYFASLKMGNPKRDTQ